MDINEFLTVDRLEAMLSAATYGLDYFAVSVAKDSAHLKSQIEKANPDICLETLWAEVILQGGNLLVVDTEDDTHHIINKAKIEQTYQTWIDQCPKDYADFCEENEDCWTGYNWLQIVIFGELVYG